MVLENELEKMKNQKVELDAELDGVKKVDLERQKQNTEVGEEGDKKDLESGEVKEV